MCQKILVSLILLFCFGCNETQFELLSSNNTSVKFTNKIIETDSLNILTNQYFYNGGGVAIADFNNDNLEDIYFTGNSVENQLYLNKGDFAFLEVSEISNSKCSNKWSTGVSVIDINNDGLLDMYIATTGTDNKDKKNILLVNQGNDKNGVPLFKDEAAKYKIDHDGSSIQGYFFDYNNDGFQDLFLINNKYTNDGVELSNRKHGIGKLKGNFNILYKNIEGKFFKNVTEEAGVLNDAYSLAANILDVNHDGWLDIFVSNDFSTSSALYINQQNGTFKENIEKYFSTQGFSSMGMDIADFDNNGEDDVITLDMLPRKLSRKKTMLPKQNPLFIDNLTRIKEKPQYIRNFLYTSVNDNFSEIGIMLDIHDTDWSWSPLFADFNNDGLKDLYITNGFPRDLTDFDFIEYRSSYTSILKTNQEYLDRIPRVKISNFMFDNKGNYNFLNNTKKWGLDYPSYSNGQAIGDLNNDGQLDIVVNNINQKAFVFRNNGTKNSNYLSLKLKGPKNNLLALQAQVFLYYNNGLLQKGKVNPYRGYLSSVSSKLHFGFTDVKSIDSLKIVWNSKEESLLTKVKTNQHLEIDYQNIKKVESRKNTHSDTWLSETNFEGLNYEHIENKSGDIYDKELQQRVYTKEGPGMAIGDINGDGLNDIVVGGAFGEKGVIFLNKNGGFEELDLKVKDIEKEIVVLELFDVDQDNDLDLYLGYGNPGMTKDSDSADYIALNDGNGNFTIEDSILPKVDEITSTILPIDVDDDGDLDLFIGSRVLVENYPASPKSSFFINENGTYSNQTKKYLGNDGKLGMVTDAKLLDINADGKEDIVLSREWQNITALLNKGNTFEQDDSMFPKNNSGLWNSIEIADIDNDGDLDIIAGNQGSNILYKPNEKPLIMKYADYSGNNKNTPLTFVYENGSYYPIHLRKNFLNQMQHKKKLFPNYSSYSQATLEDVLTEEELKKSKTLELNEINSILLENNQGKFVKHLLPQEVQFAPVFATRVMDLNNDGNNELIVVGNDDDFERFSGKRDASVGQVISVDKNLNFKVVPSEISGFRVKGYGRELKNWDKSTLIIVLNNGSLKTYKTN